MDHELALSTAEVRPERDFSGQRFVHHVARAAWSLEGFECRSACIAEATAGLAEVNVVRSAVRPDAQESSNRSLAHAREFRLLYFLAGEMQLREGDAALIKFTAGDSVVLPANMEFGIDSFSEDVEFLEIRLPALDSAPAGEK